MRSLFRVLRMLLLLGAFSFFISAAAQDTIVEDLSTVDEAQISSQVDQLSEELKDLKSDYRWTVSTAGLLLIIAGFFGYREWSALKRKARSIVEGNIEKVAKESIAKRVDDVLRETQARAEDELLRIAHILALHSSKSYDAALKEFGWSGSVPSLRSESPPMRRALIECLFDGEDDRDRNRVAAWEAALELAQEDKTFATHRLVLRMAIRSRRFPEGVRHFENNREQILGDKISAQYASTLLRRTGRIDEALEIAQRYSDDQDLATSVSIAVLQRDLGRFDDVNDTLRPQVNKLLESDRRNRPEGWNRAVNTYVANCIDRRRPEDAVAAAKFVTQGSPKAVETFTVGRLVLALPTANESREGLERAFRQCVEGLGSGEATTRCLVVQAQLDRDFDRAVEILQNAISEEQARQSSGRMSNDEYFQRCNLGQVFCSLDRFRDAINILTPAAQHSFGGEAKFRLAESYAMSKDCEDAALWLKQAFDESPKWAQLARDHGDLTQCETVLKLLRDKES